jgi:hypothetical protein
MRLMMSMLDRILLALASRPPATGRRARRGAYLQAAVAESVGLARRGNTPWTPLEYLEPRQLMTTLYWDTSVTAGLQSGNGVWSTSVANWNTAADGSGSHVAWTNGADAVFSVSGTSAVTISSSVNANSVTFSGAGYSLSGTVNGNVSVATNAATLDGVTLNGNLAVVNQATLTIRNGLTLNGTLTLQDAGYDAFNTTLAFPGTQMLTGSGCIVMAGQGARILAQGEAGVAGTLTLDSGLVVHARGAITTTADGSIINCGTILADSDGRLYASLADNQGQVNVSSGTVFLDGEQNTGTVTLSGGELNLWGNMSDSGMGTLVQTGGVLNAQPPVVMTGVDTGNFYGSEITLLWDSLAANSAVTDIRVLRDDQFLADLAASATNFLDRQVWPGTTYHYALIPWGFRGQVGPMATIDVTYAPDTLAPGAPQGLSVVQATVEDTVLDIPAQVVLQWAPARDNNYGSDGGSGIAGYNVYRSDIDYGTTPINTGLVTTTTYTDTAVDSAWSSYTYTVKAVDGAGNETTYYPPQVTATPSNAAPHTATVEYQQYIPAAYHDYFYNDLTARYRKLVDETASISSSFAFPVAAQSWFDACDPNAGYADVVFVKNDFGQIAQPLSSIPYCYFYDANHNNRFDAGERAWITENYSGVYHPGEATIVSGGTIPDGQTWSHSSGVFYLPTGTDGNPGAYNANDALLTDLTQIRGIRDGKYLFYGSSVLSVHVLAKKGTWVSCRGCRRSLQEEYPCPTDCCTTVSGSKATSGRGRSFPPPAGVSVSPMSRGVCGVPSVPAGT